MKLLLIGVVALAACHQKDGEYDHPVGMEPQQIPDDQTCPLIVPGTSVTYEDETGGGALVFVTTGDVDAVRKHAAELASVFDARPPGADPQHLAPPSCRMSDCMAGAVDIPAKATATDVPKGSRVAFIASGAETSSELASSLRMHAEHLAHAVGTCQMSM